MNTVHPWDVDTAMGSAGPEAASVVADNPNYSAAMGQYLFEPPISTPEDIANAALLLPSDESRTRIPEHG